VGADERAGAVAVAASAGLQIRGAGHLFWVQLGREVVVRSSLQEPLCFGLVGFPCFEMVVRYREQQLCPVVVVVVVVVVVCEKAWLQLLCSGTFVVG